MSKDGSYWELEVLDLLHAKKKLAERVFVINDASKRQVVVVLRRNRLTGCAFDVGGSSPVLSSTFIVTQRYSWWSSSSVHDQTRKATLSARNSEATALQYCDFQFSWKKISISGEGCRRSQV